MPVLPQAPQVAPVNLGSQFISGLDASRSLMDRADANSRANAAEARNQALYEIVRPVKEANAKADIAKARVTYDSTIELENSRATGYDIYGKALKDFQWIQTIEDMGERAQKSGEWVSRYSQLRNIKELEPQMASLFDQANKNRTDYIQQNMMGGAEIRSFRALLKEGGLSDEETNDAVRVKLGLKGRASSAGAQIKSVVGADGVTRQLIFDPVTQETRIATAADLQPAQSASAAPSVPTAAASVTAPATVDPLQSQTPLEKARDVEKGKSQAEREAKLITDAPKRRAAIRSAQVKQTRLTEDIDDLIAKVDSSTAGPGGTLLAHFPGTSATDLRANLDTIKANLGFQELQALRDASPTGGALGQVTENETRFLQATLGSLDIGQSPAQLRANLAKVKKRIQESFDLIHRAYDDEFGDKN